jgi:hypothetical protein
MKNKISLIGLLVIAIMVILYIINKDSLPPRTPHKVARLISGLSIPDDSKVLEFKDQWSNFNGNGYSYIVIRLDNNSFEKIYKEANEGDYRNLPIVEDIYGPLKTVSDKQTVGVYKVSIDDESTMSFQGTVLSENDKSVMVYFSVN